MLCIMASWHCFMLGDLHISVTCLYSYRSSFNYHASHCTVPYESLINSNLRGGSQCLGRFMLGKIKEKNLEAENLLSQVAQNQ